MAGPLSANAPAAPDIAAAYQRADQRDGDYLYAREKDGPLASLYKPDRPAVRPDIRDVHCQHAGSDLACTYKKVEADDSIYFPCRGRFVPSSEGWTFKARDVLPPLKVGKTDFPSHRDDQTCSAAYRALDYTAPTDRVSRPTRRVFKALYRHTAWDPHAIASCRNKVRKFQCVPVESDLAQYECRYEDRHVNAKDWIVRRTVIEFNKGWSYAEGDAPTCTVVGFDMGDRDDM